MSARPAYREYVTWTPTHTLLVTSNHAPRPNDLDGGTTRRVVIVPFERSYLAAPDPDDPRQLREIPNLRQRILASQQALEAVLAWQVEGAARWTARGHILPELPESVHRATSEWLEAADLLGQFFDDHLEPDPASVIPTRFFLEEFREHCRQAGQAPWSKRYLMDRIKDSDRFPEAIGETVRLGRDLHPSLRAEDTITGWKTPESGVLRGVRGVRWREEDRE